MTTNTSVYARIIKREKQADGTLLVTGIATDDTLDVDQQICDPEWLSRAMPEWFKFGNIREQHSNIAAGVATKYEQDGTQHIVTARVVDPNSVSKVEAGVLKGFSIGIREPRIAKDKAAPGGRIVDGQIVEVSLVDRPANPSCLLELAKSVGGVMQQTETLIEKGTVMERCSKCDKACKSDELDDNRMCMECAVKAAEESSEESSAEESSTEESTEESSEESKAVAPEESSQEIGEESSQVMGEESSREGGVAGVAGLAADDEGENTEGSLGESEATEESENSDIRDTLARIESLLTQFTSSSKSTEETAEAVKALGVRVSKVEKSASPHGPVRTVVKAAPAVDPSAMKAAKAADYRAKAAATSDPALASGYLLLASEAESNN